MEGEAEGKGEGEKRERGVREGGRVSRRAGTFITLSLVCSTVSGT